MTIHHTNGPGCPPFASAAGMPTPAELTAPGDASDGRVLLLSAENQIVGHAALWWSDTPLLDGERIGTIGGFAAADESSALTLLEAACVRLREAGCKVAVGPMNGNTWRKHRFITWSGGRGAYLLEPRNPEPYPAWWQAAGFTALSNYSSSAVPLDGKATVPAALESRLNRAGVTIRMLDPARYEEDLRAIHGVSVRSFCENFLYTPLDEAEFVATYSKLRERVDPELVRIAERDGAIVGFVFCVADLEAAARGEKPALIVKTLAVDPTARCAGLGSLLVDQVQQAGRAKGFTEAIHATQHESNNVKRITGRHAGEPFRRYTLFSKLL